jgi:hypothetical protein
MHKGQLFLIIFVISEITATCFDDPLCRVCGTSCSYCMSSFYSSTQSVCVAASKTIDNCIQYHSEGVCKGCSYQYNIDATGACQPIGIPDCMVSTPKRDGCLICKSGLPQDNGKCDGSRTCSLENCKMCLNFAGTETCTLCKDGFYLGHNEKLVSSCFKTTPEMSNCDFGAVDIATKKSKCVVCEFGYRQTETGCVRNPSIIIKSSQQVLGIIWVLLLASLIFMGR